MTHHVSRNKEVVSETMKQYKHTQIGIRLSPFHVPMVGHPPAGNETNTQAHRKHLPALRPHRKPLSEVVHGCHLWMRHNPSRRRPPTTPMDRVRLLKTRRRVSRSGVIGFFASGGEFHLCTVSSCTLVVPRTSGHNSLLDDVVKSLKKIVIRQIVDGGRIV